MNIQMKKILLIVTVLMVTIFCLFFFLKTTFKPKTSGSHTSVIASYEQNKNTNKLVTDKTLQVETHTVLHEKQSMIETDLDVIDMAELNLGADSTFEYLKLVERTKPNEIIGIEVFINSEIYTLDDFGLLRGDIITHVGQAKIENAGNFKTKLASYKPYGTVIVTINRNNESFDLELELD